MPVGPGLRLAVSLLTVIPVPGRSGAPERRTATVAMSLAPLVGVAIGLAAAGAGVGLHAAGAGALVAATAAVGLGALLTRGLHLDGLADTVDGLGSYRDATQALEIMRKPDIGPLGVVAIVLVLLAQVAAAAALLGRTWPAAVAGIVAATATGRVAIALGCRRGVPAARPDGLGALVAGVVGRPALVLGVTAVGALSLPAGTPRWWLGPAAVAAGLLAAVGLRRHVVRRLGGITGDVLGALCEVSVTIAYIVVSM